VNPFLDLFQSVLARRRIGAARGRFAVALLLLLWASVSLTASAFATPAEEITGAVAVNGASDVSQSPSRQFVKAFNAVALRISARALPEYVAAAIKLRPGLAPNIVAVAIKAAVKNSESKPETLCGLIQQIVKVAIAASPDAAASITRAGVSASPDSRRWILEAAVSAAPDNKDAIVEAANVRTQPFAFLTFSATDLSGFSFTPATLNPANISDLGGATSVNSPEQPPSSH
jgi:hypothetical protein